MNRLVVETVADGIRAGRTLPSAWYSDGETFELELKEAQVEEGSTTHAKSFGKDLVWFE